MPARKITIHGLLPTATLAGSSPHLSVRAFPEVRGDIARVVAFERWLGRLYGLVHPNLACIHEYGVQEGTPYLMVETRPGPSLIEFIEARGRLSLRVFARIAAQLLQVLEHIHAREVGHGALDGYAITVQADGTAPPQLILHGVGIQMLRHGGASERLIRDDLRRLPGLLRLMLVGVRPGEPVPASIAGLLARLADGGPPSCAGELLDRLIDALPSTLLDSRLDAESRPLPRRVWPVATAPTLASSGPALPRLFAAWVVGLGGMVVIALTIGLALFGGRSDGGRGDAATRRAPVVRPASETGAPGATRPADARDTGEMKPVREIEVREPELPVQGVDAKRPVPAGSAEAVPVDGGRAVRRPRS